MFGLGNTAFVQNIHIDFLSLGQRTSLEEEAQRMK